MATLRPKWSSWPASDAVSLASCCQAALCGEEHADVVAPRLVLGCCRGPALGSGPEDEEERPPPHGFLTAGAGRCFSWGPSTPRLEGAVRPHAWFWQAFTFAQPACFAK